MRPRANVIVVAPEACAPPPVNLVGLVRERLTVREFAGLAKRDTRLWRCDCSCGGESVVREEGLLGKRTRSCGCLQREAARATLQTHGATNTPEHQSWRAMRDRCQRKGSNKFAAYGARGIYVCARWQHSFPAFLEDMGLKPTPKHTIERRDNAGSYTCGHCDDCKARGAPANCRWATNKEQQRNKRTNLRVEVGGETITMAELSERSPLPYGTIRRRVVDSELPPEVASTAPAGTVQRKRSKFTADDVRDIRARVAAGETQVSVARVYGVGDNTVSRIVNGLRWREVA